MKNNIITMKDIIKSYDYYIINTNKSNLYFVGKTSELMGFDVEEPQDPYELDCVLRDKTVVLKSNDIDYERDKDVVVHDFEGTIGECIAWIKKQREISKYFITKAPDDCIYKDTYILVRPSGYNSIFNSYEEAKERMMSEIKED